MCVGVPNVGKSTLFNALAGERIAIVKDTPGITRDRIYTDVEWLDWSFTLIDTGGIEPDSKDIILSQMREQAESQCQQRMLLFSCGLIEVLMMCFVFVSVDHPECEACYLETLEQDNYHQGKSSLIMLFLPMFSMHSRSPSLPNLHAA